MNNAYFRRATVSVLNSSAPSFSEQSINRSIILDQQRQHAKTAVHPQTSNDDSRSKD